MDRSVLPAPAVFFIYVIDDYIIPNTSKEKQGILQITVGDYLNQPVYQE
jgi:hypothetical protein